MSCQHAPTCASGLVEVLQNHKGKKIAVFIGGREGSLSGTVLEVNPGSNTLTLEYEYSLKRPEKDGPTTSRAKYFIDINRISAIEIYEK